MALCKQYIKVKTSLVAGCQIFTKNLTVNLRECFPFGFSLSFMTVVGPQWFGLQLVPITFELESGVSPCLLVFAGQSVEQSAKYIIAHLNFTIAFLTMQLSCFIVGIFSSVFRKAMLLVCESHCSPNGEFDYHAVGHFTVWEWKRPPTLQYCFTPSQQKRYHAPPQTQPPSHTQTTTKRTGVQHTQIHHEPNNNNSKCSYNK